MNKVKGLALCLALVFSVVGLVAQTPQWQWAVRAGGTGEDLGYNIATDSQGNQYVTGVFSGTASFGPYTLNSSGPSDIFAAKLDPNGNILWAVRAGGTNDDYGWGIAVDGAGNTYLTGCFEGSSAFGPYTLTSNGDWDFFAAKMDPNGNFLWAVRAGGESSDGCYGIVVDGAGNTYLTGCFEGSSAFGPYTLTSSGSSDIFAAKLDPTGNWLWAVRAGGTGSDYGFDIALDNQGNQYVTGVFSGTASFGPYTLNSSGEHDIFAAKLDPNSNFLWAVRAGGTNDDYGWGIAVDESGNTYLTGNFYGSVVFGPYTLTSSGSKDIFAAKLDPNGNWLWAVRAGGTDHDYGRGIAVDGAGNAYLTGNLYDSAAFGPYTLTSSGNSDIFAAKLDTNGNWLWVVRAGGGGVDIGIGIAVDGSGNAYLTGYFEGSAAFSPYTLTSSGSYDIFAAKLTEPLNTAQITIISPNGGESLIGNTISEIQWNAIGVSFVYIDLKENEYSDWIQLESMPITAALGSYGWQVPNINTDQAMIRIRCANDPSIFDVSDNPFTIYTLLTLVSPNGGGSYLANSTQVINWFARPSVSQVVLDLSVDDGFSWSTLTNAPINAALGEYYCTLPNITTNYARVRVSDANNPTINDISDSPFSIVATSPYPPQNICISISNYDVQVSWDAVTWFSLDGPIMPDYYLVYSSDDSYQNFSLVGITPDLSYTQPYIAMGAARKFYKVTAVKFYRDNIPPAELEKWVAEQFKPGMPEEEVFRLCRSFDR